jgi:hypothetical protein
LREGASFFLHFLFITASPQKKYMHFQKQDLERTHYSWPEEFKVYAGQPSRRSFDRFNGHQVLFLINFYGSQSDRFTVEEGKTIENMIQEELPIGIKSEISVFNWLRDAAVAQR